MGYILFAKIVVRQQIEKFENQQKWQRVLSTGFKKNNTFEKYINVTCSVKDAKFLIFYNNTI